MAFEPDTIKSPDNYFATPIVFSNHLFDISFAGFESFYSRHLRHVGWAEHGMLVYFTHHGNEVCRTNGIAQAPAGHGVSFGKAVKHDSSLFHPG